MSQEKWFRRNDGQEFCFDAGGVDEQLVSRNPLFVRIDGPEGKELAVGDQGPDSTIVDLSYMSKTELIELAKTILDIVKTMD